MSTILESLSRLQGATLGTVVHVNPSDADVVEHYAELGATRVVLVSSDPVTLPALRQAGSGRPAIEVVEATVAPTAGNVQWQRFNVREVSGLLDAASRLSAFYPRLEIIERLPLVSITLQSLLERIALRAADKSTSNLLVLDAPGLDGLLLQGLTSPLCELFDLILVRGARAGLFESAVDHTVALRWLHERFYRNMEQAGDTDPLWVVSLLRFDQVAAEHAGLARALEELKTQLAIRVREHDATALQLSKARHEQAQATVEYEAQVKTLTDANASITQRAQDIQTQLDQLARAKALTENLVVEREAQVKTLTDANASITQRVQDIQTQLDQLTQAKALTENLVVEREAQSQALSLGKSQAETIAQERLEQIEQLRRTHAHEAKSLTNRLAHFESRDREHQERLIELQRNVARFEEEQRAAAKRQQVLYEELLKAEAQIELIKDVSLRVSGQ